MGGRPRARFQAATAARSHRRILVHRGRFRHDPRLRCNAALAVASAWAPPLAPRRPPAGAGRAAARASRDTAGARAGRPGRRQGGRPADPSQRRAGRGAGAAREPARHAAADAVSDAARPADRPRARWSPGAQDGLDKDPAVQRQMPRAADQALQTALLSKEVGPHGDRRRGARPATTSDIAGKPGEEEVHARHILVDNEAKAKKIIAELKKGADFAALAKQYSKDPGGAQQGGDLGFFKKDDMVPEFAAAAFALKPGEISPDAGAHPVRLARDPGGGAPPAPAAELRAGARRNAPEDDPGGRAEGGGEGARRGDGGEVQPGRHAAARHRHRRAAAQPPAQAQSSD